MIPRNAPMSKLVVAQRQMTVAAIWPFLVAHPPPRAPVAIGSRGNWIAEYLMMTKTKNLCCSDNQIIYEGSSYGLGPVLHSPALLPRPNWGQMPQKYYNLDQKFPKMDRLFRKVYNLKRFVTNGQILLKVHNYSVLNTPVLASASPHCHC